MSVFTGKAEVTIEAKVTRADGTVENLGVVSRTKVENKSLLKRLFNKNHGNSTNKHRESGND